jgi:hypothetical protein
MSLDVYVGPLSQYYAAQRGSASAGMATDRVATTTHIRLTVLAWRKGLTESLGANIDAPLDWDESAAAPGFSARPGWDGFGSLVLWAAYAEHPSLQRPGRLSEGWEDDPALGRSNGLGFRSRYAHIVRNVEIWLPSSFQSTFESEDIDRRRVVMGSLPTLRRQLDELNGATWKAGNSVVDGWRQISPTGDASLEQCARFGLAVMADAAQRAIDLHLPMKLDY